MNKKISRAPWIVLGTLFVNWILLLAGLARQNLWIDEWFTIDIVRTPWSSFVSHIITTERRPPLHYLLLKLGAPLIGGSEYVMRLYSAALVVLSVAIAYAVGRRLLGQRGGMIAAFLLGVSPFVILYGRMIRAYGQTMLLGLLLTWVLLHTVKKPTPGRWVLYGLIALALVYTDYSGLAVLGGPALYVLAQGDRRVRAALSWVGAAAMVGIGYLPWLPIALTQKAHPVRLTDFATGLVGFGLKLGYPFYAWGAGETIFPWHPAALPAVSACGLLLLWGLVILFQKNRLAFWLLVGGIAGPLVFTAALLALVATDIPFLDAASRSSAAAPFFYWGVSAGLVMLRSRSIRLLALLCVGAAFSVALFNYAEGRQFHNPIYAVLIRQAVAGVQGAIHPGDLILAESDTLFCYYYDQSSDPAACQGLDPQANEAWIVAHRPGHIWMVTFGRDSTADSVSKATNELDNWLANHYGAAVQTRGYVPQDPLYQTVKQRLLHRPAYSYKLVIYEYAQP